MFLDGPDVADLPAVLTTVAARARDYGPLPLGALVDNLCDRVEPLDPLSRYLGVGVSSIDLTREGAESMPWDGLAHLVDGTRMSLHGTRSEIPPTVMSTHTLDAEMPSFVNRVWQWATSAVPAPISRPDLAGAHSGLADLHEYLKHCTDPDMA